MSRKCKFRNSFVQASAGLGGAHLTVEARERTHDNFCSKMEEMGFTHLSSIVDVGGKQLRLYVAARKDDGVQVRTLQNEMSHLRQPLREAGRACVADAQELSNAALGIAGGRRTGTKEAITLEQFVAVKEAALALGRHGIAQIINLQRHFGLRANEAIHARADTLARWEREVNAKGRILVTEGTKGGRDREVRIFDRESALAAIRQAREVAERQNGFLILRADGDNAQDLASARGMYAAWANREELETHTLRYAFAQDQYRRYRTNGFSNREALAMLCKDLGHGDGRGRWVKSVYLRGMEPTEFSDLTKEAASGEDPKRAESSGMESGDAAFEGAASPL